MFQEFPNLGDWHPITLIYEALFEVSSGQPLEVAHK